MSATLLLPFFLDRLEARPLLTDGGLDMRWREGKKCSRMKLDLLHLGGFCCSISYKLLHLEVLLGILVKHPNTNKTEGLNS